MTTTTQTPEDKAEARYQRVRQDVAALIDWLKLDLEDLDEMAQTKVDDEMVLDVRRVRHLLKQAIRCISTSTFNEIEAALEELR